MTTTSHQPSLPGPISHRTVTAADEAVLHRLWDLFRHEMSAWTGELPDGKGGFRRERLARALDGRPGWAAWIAMAGGHPVGLAVARALDEDEHVLSSFFVVRAARRAGVGHGLARAVLASMPGRWAVAYQDANVAAAAFWADLAGSLDPAWTFERRAVPGRPDLPPDSWIRLTAGCAGTSRSAAP